MAKRWSGASWLLVVAACGGEPAGQGVAEVSMPRMAATPDVPVTVAASSGGRAAGSAAGGGTAAAAGGGAPAVTVAAVGGSSSIASAAAVGGAPALAPADVCADSGEFTRAVRLQFDASWGATLGLDAGSGTVSVYTKLRYYDSGGRRYVEARPCGTALPVITTSALVDHLKSSNRIPSAAFDSPSMPVDNLAVGSTASMLAIDSGPGLLGIALASSDAVWPEPDALMTVDHDGDGKPGVTAIPDTGTGFLAPPVDVSQERAADRIYIAARVQFALLAAAERCSSVREGTADIRAFNYAIVGCHVQGGDECTAAESRFIARAAPLFDVHPMGQWSQRAVSADAKCGDVQAVFDAP